MPDFAVYQSPSGYDRSFVRQAPAWRFIGTIKAAEGSELIMAHGTASPMNLLLPGNAKISREIDVNTALYRAKDGRYGLTWVPAAGQAQAGRKGIA